VAGDGAPIRFTSSMLPPYLRRANSLENLLPWLNLKVIFIRDFGEALVALLGPWDLACRPPPSRVRLKEARKTGLARDPKGTT
jgi:hypothetical protein